jgi:membrane-associated phospholipid phosphatase
VVTADERSGKKPREVNALPLVSEDAPPPLIWKWRTFTATDYAVTVSGSALTLAAAIIAPRPRRLLSGGIWFDEGARDVLRADSLSNRYVYRDASDVGLSLTVTWPFVADALVAAWWYRGSREVAEQMALINLQTLAVSGALQGVTNVLVGRERPYGRDCGSDSLPADAIDCTGAIRHRSFFSGHASFSFTGAALVCVHHFENELLGPPWDAVSCGAAYGIAATTAAFRNVSDVHYASDTITGALLGTLVGYGIPWLHYRSRGGGTAARRAEVRLVPTPGGLGLAGAF